MTKLTKITKRDWPLNHEGNNDLKTEIIISFSNDRHHAVEIDSDMTPEEIGKRFIHFGQNIIRDRKLK